ncbi:unnamed protein product [Durusdinium trenchii]|uniref:Cupin type-1 domain-containing protein n=2 Tax=Durusdinium trenchii TaxID=1381693 RepID=A0ABP0JZL8_9DINO
MADLLWYLLAFAVVLGARGDAVLTRNENEGLQDGRHQRFPCVREARVTSWDQAEAFKINHEPYTNEKKVFIRKGEVAPLTQVSLAEFKAETYFEDHDHEDMFEVFYVLSGAGRFAITERGSDREWRRREVAAKPGLFLHLPPGVQHAGLTDLGFQFLMLGAAAEADCSKTAILGDANGSACKALTSFQELQVDEVEVKGLKKNPKVQRRTLLPSGGMPKVMRFEHLTVPNGVSYDAPREAGTQVFILLTGWGGIRLGVKTGLFEHHAVALVPQVGAEHPVTITAASPQLTMLRLVVEPCPIIHDEL